MKILLCQVEFSVPILIEIRHCLADQDVAHVLSVFGVDEGSELLLVELQVTTRQALLPDPEFDPITALFYRLVLEGEENGQVGCITVGLTRLEGVTNIRKVDSELDLVKTVVRLVRDADPDILGGGEVQGIEEG